MTASAEHYICLDQDFDKADRSCKTRKVSVPPPRAKPGYHDTNSHTRAQREWQDGFKDTVLEHFPSNNPLLARYELRGEIGRGGMAVVFRARDTALDRDVALKFLAESMTEDPLMANLFQQEAKAAARLNHPNIVTIYDYGTLEGRAFICMELVAGETVEQILGRDGRLSTLDALAIAEDILCALDYAHSKGTIHRDIKPSNMIRNERGECKLLDFGLAKSVSDGQKTSAMAGTPIYMAPEQLTGRGVGTRSDLFALGATLYEMLSGIPPFNNTARDMAPPPLRATFPGVPAMLDNLILRTLAFDIKERVQSAQEMLDPIQHILNSVRTYLHTSSTRKPSPTSAPRRSAAPSVSEPVSLDDKVTRNFKDTSGQTPHG